MLLHFYLHCPRIEQGIVIFQNNFLNNALQKSSYTKGYDTVHVHKSYSPNGPFSIVFGQ